MAGETNITVIGNLTADPELRFTASGAPVANFTVASTPRTFDKATSQWKDGETLFLRCSVWRDQAEHVSESLGRGSRVTVTGALKQRTFEKDGVNHTVIEMDADEVSASLKYATAKLTKAVSKGNGGNGNGAAKTAAAEQAPAQAAPAKVPVAAAVSAGESEF